MFEKLIAKNLPAILKAVKHAEANGEGKTGAQKLDMAVDFLNGLIDIPVVPEAVEAMILKAALTTVVEMAKSLWGKSDWFKQLSAYID
jgi:hypothetical protein